MSEEKKPYDGGMRSFHLCLDIRGALMNWKRRDFEKMFRHDDGRFMKPDEAKAALHDELLKGHKYIPMGDCEGFDPKEKRCPGHPQRVAEESK